MVVRPWNPSTVKTLRVLVCAPGIVSPSRQTPHCSLRCYHVGRLPRRHDHGDGAGSGGWRPLLRGHQGVVRRFCATEALRTVFAYSRSPSLPDPSSLHTHFILDEHLPSVCKGGGSVQGRLCTCSTGFRGHIPHERPKGRPFADLGPKNPKNRRYSVIYDDL